MGSYVWQSGITVPKSTPASAPLVYPPSIGDVWLDRIEVMIPPGPKGLLAFYIANSGTPVVPFNGYDNWIYADSQLLEYPLGVEVHTGLAVYAYNTDVNPHAFWVRWIGRPMTLESVPSATSVVPQMVIVS
jgi:hypothetical protein